MKGMARMGTAACAVIAGAYPALAGEPAGLKGDLLAIAEPADASRIVIEPAAFNDQPGYDFDTFGNHTEAIWWQTAGIFAGTVALGFVDWDWGSSSFHFESEDFFGNDTKNGGMDKLGHAYGTFLLTDLFTDAIRNNAQDPTYAPITGSLLAMGVMTTVEIMDGFSGDHGFAWEDMVFNATGASFSVLRNSVPGLREKIDYRLEYVPSGNAGGFRPHSDYSGQKYVLALKLAGFDAFEETPLRFLELQAGYFARGFTREEKDDGKGKRRVPYVGIGLNLQELLFGYDGVRDTTVGRWGRKTLEYVQVPYTYIRTD